MANSEAGCSHYGRNCSLVAPCCDKVYVCRVCHDEAEEHSLVRSDVSEVVCEQCQTRQPVNSHCINCKIEFAKYFCSKCRLYDNVDKQQFHCDACGLCRIGGRENFFHCEKCDVCLSITMKDSHECLEKISHKRCPVCLLNLHTSRQPSQIPKCRHMIHVDCFENLLHAGHYACPICGKSMVNMNNIWKMRDEEVMQTEMPDEYKNVTTKILCRDCRKENVVPLHFLGMKCPDCGSYNTCR